MLKSKASSSAGAAITARYTGREPALAQLKSAWLMDLDHSQFDLLTVLTYLSSVATANLSREQIFDSAARLGYNPSPYFAQVANLVQSLGYDYSHACHVIARRCKDEVMRQFLLRFGNSMASGEPEAVFLAREMGVLMEDYTNEYERAIETLRKWTDAFVALMVSANLIVLVALISNMIYNLGSVFMLVIESVAIIAAGLGAYLIYRIAPYDPIVHQMEQRSEEQERMLLCARICLPLALALGLAVWLALGSLGLALVLAGLVILPLGVVTILLERKIDARDRDIADFLRALGGVTAARGSTVIESLNHIDQRAIGSLEPELKRLMTRVACGLNTGLAWMRFMADTGSELVHRVVRAFWDGCDYGGEPDKVGRFSADMALRVWLLRAKRKLVSSTFNYVVIPMHIALIATLVFMSEVVAAFNEKLLEAQAITQSENTTSLRPEDIGIPGALAFQAFDTDFVHMMVMIVVLSLTVINAFAPRAASGGHRFKMALFGAITLVSTGLVLLLVPPVASSMFSDTLAQPLE
jgi:flagellar protein FlaJ